MFRSPFLSMLENRDAISKKKKIDKCDSDVEKQIAENMNNWQFKRSIILSCECGERAIALYSCVGNLKLQKMHILWYNNSTSKHPTETHTDV